MHSPPKIQELKFHKHQIDSVCSLLNLSFTPMPSLIRESVSYYDVVIRFESTFSGVPDEIIVLSKQLKQYCWWTLSGERHKE